MNNIKQSGAELCLAQAQVKLEVIVEVGGQVGLGVGVQLLVWIGYGRWICGRITQN